MDLNSLLGPLGNAATWSISVTSNDGDRPAIVLVTASTAMREGRDSAWAVAEQLESAILAAGWRSTGAQLVSFRALRICGW